MEQAIGSRVLDPRLNDPRVDTEARVVRDARLSEASAIGSTGKSAASWGAIIAGAFVAASVSLILLALGSGLGFAEISPWPERGVSPSTFTVTTAIWLIVTQWASAALGGYIAGRLRTRWVGLHTHEVFFRDTAHGLVTWSVATVVVAAVVATSVFSVVGGSMRVAANVASAGANVASAGAQGAIAQGSSYGIDKLFRPAAGSSGAGGASGALIPNGPNGAASPQSSTDPRAEAGRILADAGASGASVSDEDRTYLAGLVAARTGISQTEAQRRVDELIAAAKDAEVKTRQAADVARKAAAEASIYTALSMLIGAFIACVAAALGGRLRDEYP